MQLKSSTLRSAAIWVCGPFVLAAIMEPLLFATLQDHGVFKKPENWIWVMIVDVIQFLGTRWFDTIAGMTAGFAIGVWRDAFVRKKESEAFPGESKFGDRKAFNKETLLISDLVGRGPPLISGMTFTKCHIIGPAFIKPHNHNSIEFCAVPDKKALLAVPENSPVLGCVFLSQNKFRECYFEKITVIGTPVDIANVNVGFDPITLAEWKAKTNFL